MCGSRGLWLCSCKSAHDDAPEANIIRPSSADAMELRVADEAGPSVECPICLRDDAAASLHKTACGHGICERCLRSYIESRPSDEGVHKCPVCRQPLSPADNVGAAPQGIPVVPPPYVWTRSRILGWTCCISTSTFLFALFIWYLCGGYRLHGGIPQAIK